jgi:hypothetical protein
MIQSILRWYYAWAPRPSEVDLLNKGLSLALVWGKNWMMPIQSRMHARFPFLLPEELDRYERDCRAAMAFGIDLVFEIAEANKGVASKSAWRKQFVARFPWVSKRNLRSLFMQGTYYAWKDGACNSSLG